MNERPERIKVRRVPLSVCLNGHTQAVEGQPGTDAWLILHKCGAYTWEDGNYCVGCGAKLDRKNA